MKHAEGTKSNSVLFLSVGLVSGFLIAAGVFFTLFHQSTPSDRAAQAAITADAQTNLQPPSLQPMYESPTVAPAVTFVPAQVPGQMPVMMQQAPGVVMLPDGTTVYPTGTLDVNMAEAGSRGYINVSPGSYSDNPNWTVSDRNGLIGNPAVDPPSSKGRAYGLSSGSTY